MFITLEIELRLQGYVTILQRANTWGIMTSVNGGRPTSFSVLSVLLRDQRTEARMSFMASAMSRANDNTYYSVQ